MSSRDRRATAPALLAAAVLVLGGCAAQLSAPGAQQSAGGAGTVARADELTHRIAVVESARQCAVTSATFADEAGITADLDDRLTAAGLTHAQWKDWHDALVDSPDLVAQLSAVSTPGCAGA